ncbi:hypothetical protein [Flavobacterium sp. U410]
MKKEILLSISLLFINVILGQTNSNTPDIFPASPDVTKIQKYGEIPVSNYTGTAQINIPIFTINEDDFNLPITLNYDGSGIKVEEESSRVGLGWSLGLQGVISREVMGRDDFDNFGTVTSCYVNAEDNSGNPIPDFIGLAIPGREVTPGLHTRMMPTDYVLDNYVEGPNIDATNDFEPDIFYYNLPGYSGKFTLKRNGTAVLQHLEHNLKIELIDSNDVITKKWKITTPNGTQFFFDINEHGFSDTGYSYQNGAHPYSTAWYLTKVITNKDNIITLNYTDSYLNPDFPVSYCGSPFALSTFYKRLSTEQSDGAALSDNSYRPFNYFSKVLITSIDFPKGRVEFEYDNRIDFVNDVRIKDITIKNNLSQKIKSYSLIHDYFNANFTGGTIGYFSNVVNFTNDALNKRLKLIEVQEKDKDDNMVMNQTFEYFDSLLPPKNSTAKDHWGFFNGVTSNISNTIPDMTFSCPIYTSTNQYANYINSNTEYTRHNIGANREVNTLYANAFLLKKITYPTKGSTEFEYESNTYDPTSSFTEDSNASKISIFQNNNINGNKFNYCGGVRIKKITNSDNNGNIYTKKFTYHYTEDRNNDGILESYSYGKLLSRPRYFGHTDFNPSIAVYSVASTIILKDNPSYENEFIGYDKVIVYDENGNNVSKGKSIYSYKNRPPYVPKYYIDIGFAYSDQGITNDPNNIYVQYSAKRLVLMFNSICLINGSSYLVRNYSFDYKPDGVKDRVYSGNGSLLEEAIYKSESSNFILQNLKSYEYNNTSLTDVKIWGVKLYRPLKSYSNESQLDWDLNYIGPAPLQYNIGTPPYAMAYNNIVNITYQSMLSSYIPGPSVVKEKKYFDTGIVETTTNFFYNNYKNLASERKTTSTGDILETNYYYAQDASMSAEPNVTALINRNMVDLPLKVERNKIINGTTEKIDSQITKYGSFPSSISGQSLLLPQYIYAGKGTMTENKITYNNYDAFGNILQYTPESGISTTVIWGYNKTQPIAKIENATYNQVQPYESNLQTLSNGTDENALLTALNSLRTALPNAMITTYTYKPLVGVSTITDSKGNKITYEYDSFNRLQYVKDKDGNILSENEYHYKN